MWSNKGTCFCPKGGSNDSPVAPLQGREMPREFVIVGTRLGKCLFILCQACGEVERRNVASDGVVQLGLLRKHASGSHGHSLRWKICMERRAVRLTVTLYFV